MNSCDNRVPQNCASQICYMRRQSPVLGEAREKCQKVLGNVAHGRHPLHGLNGVEGLTLGEFIDECYAPWAKANRSRTAANTLDKLKRYFGTWFAEPLSANTIERIESWKVRRLNAGCTASTVLRDMFTLSSVLRRAIRLGKLMDNPVRRVEKPRIDRRPKVRFFSEEEESRLRVALNARDAEMREARESSNAWRKEREYQLLPPRLHFGDHLTPAVILPMYTGLRRGELLALRWESIDFSRRILTVEAGTAKNRQTRHVPLNDEAMGVLTRWREQVNEGPRVFAVRTSFKTAWAKLLKRANITKFRWHDLLHHFASRLVQVGVPLNTVRDLLGHSLGGDVLAIRPLGARPEARGGRQTQREAASCAYNALTGESRIPEHIPTPLIGLVVREGLEPSTSAL
jgi:integrase